MPGSPRRRPRTTIIMMVLLSFTVITIGSKDVPVLGSVRGAMIDVLGPVGRGFKSATKPVRSWWGGVNDYDRIAAENDKLRDEVERLKAKQAANSSAAAELARLKELEGLPFIADIDSKVALISTGAYSSFDDNTMTIDRGATSGFKVGMPVVDRSGLVGRLESVFDDRSVIRLITDPDFAVYVKLASTGSYAAGHGTGPDRPFLVDSGVNLDQEVNKGEGIFTSGIGTGSFPGDLPIGTVTKVSASQSDLTQVLEVKLAADLERLSAVRVLLWEPPT